MIKNKLAHLIKGKTAEQQAEEIIKRQGLTVLQRNFHSKFGEIDLIALEDNILVFIEVRFRTSHQFGSAVETVTISKQKKIIKAASYFLHCQPDLNKHTMRFDVIGLNSKGELDWIKGAFLAT